MREVLIGVVVGVDDARRDIAGDFLWRKGAGEEADEVEECAGNDSEEGEGDPSVMVALAGRRRRGEGELSVLVTALCNCTSVSVEFG